MALSVGVYTSDPNLLRCELARLRPDLPWGEAPDAPLGAGWFADGDVLLQRYGPRVRPDSLDQMEGVLESDALIAHAAPLPLGLSLEENTPPWRYRQWLFAGQGHLGAPERFRALAQDVLPEHLLRVVKGALPQEWAFALFLAALREAGRTDDERLEAKTLAQIARRAASQLETLAGEAGARPPAFAFIATSGRLLCAARLGDQPLYYRLLEGAPTCPVCRLDGSAEKEPLVREHLRRRTVVVATGLKDPRGWLPVQPGEAVAVGRSLDVEKADARAGQA